MLCIQQMGVTLHVESLMHKRRERGGGGKGGGMSGTNRTDCLGAKDWVA